MMFPLPCPALMKNRHGNDLLNIAVIFDSILILNPARVHMHTKESVEALSLGAHVSISVFPGGTKVLGFVIVVFYSNEFAVSGGGRTTSGQLKKRNYGPPLLKKKRTKQNGDTCKQVVQDLTNDRSQCCLSFQVAMSEICR